ncbi:hypothetical protein PMAC_002681 [Pneumocystis sp. 'macacae']|nr:hypothetical protein PMAC_002681 [Pneumocystis sp. 'macacae']
MKGNKSSIQPRLPSLSDLPSPLTGIIIAHDTLVSNCLILLHGLGGSHLPFARLARHLNLPQTVCISLRGLKPVPLVSDLSDDDSGSWHWGTDLTFDQDGLVSDDADLHDAIQALQALCRVLTAPPPVGCGFRSQAIFLMGFGQGGRLALLLALAQGRLPPISATFIHPDPTQTPCSSHLGGILSIGGIIEHPSSSSQNNSVSASAPHQSSSNSSSSDHFNHSSTLPPQHSSSRIPTPILICGGDDDSSITPAAIQTLRDIFYDVEYVVWDDHYADTMPKSPREWYPLLQWFSRRLLHT